MLTPKIAVLVIVGATDVFVMFSNRIFDTSSYTVGEEPHPNVEFAVNHWYGFWEICSEALVGDGTICSDWTQEKLGTWSPSEFWANPKPLGTYYTPAALSAIILFNFVPLVSRYITSSYAFVNRFCVVASFLGNWVVVVVLTGIVNSIPISDVPTKRNSQMTKGFYGPAWYAITAATGRV